MDTVLEAGTCAGLVAASICVRRRATGRYPGGWFWGACVVGVAAVTVGTVRNLPGTLLAVPVIMLSVFAIWRGGWRVGDAGLFLLLLGAGSAGAYLMAAALDPDTGSSADQGAFALAVIGAVTSTAAIVWWLARKDQVSRSRSP